MYVRICMPAQANRSSAVREHGRAMGKRMTDASRIVPQAAVPTLLTLWQQATRALTEAGIDTARLDARLLVQHVTAQRYETLLCAGDTPVDAERVAHLQQLLDRRLMREPIAQILGEKEFYGLRFAVTRDTLTPGRTAKRSLRPCWGIARIRSNRCVFWIWGPEAGVCC